MRVVFWAQTAFLPAPTTKRCSKCRRELAVGSFRKDRGECRECEAAFRARRRSAHIAAGRCEKGCGRDMAPGRTRCPECRAKRWACQGILAADGASPFTVEMFEALNEKQGGVCACCGKGRGKQELNVDHEHRNPDGSGPVRALLCGTCNSRVIASYEGPNRRRRALDYLLRYDPACLRRLHAEVSERIAQLDAMLAELKDAA